MSSEADDARRRANAAQAAADRAKSDANAAQAAADAAESARRRNLR